MTTYTTGFPYMVTAANFWPDFMRNEAGNLICSYIAARGGAALGAFSGGAVGSYFGPAGAIPGRRIGASIGGAAGAALGAAWCPGTPPDRGEWPLRPTPLFTGGQCPQQYQVFSGTDYDGFDNGQGPQRAETQPGNVSTGPFTGIVQGPSQTAAPVFYWQGPNIPEFSLTAYQLIPGGINPRPYANLVPVPGNPNNCGNAPGQDGRPRLPGVPTDVPRFRDDPFARRNIDVDIDFGGSDININGDLVLDGPNIGPDGGLEICFVFDGLRFCIDPFGGVRIGPGAGGPEGGGGGGDDPEDSPLRVLSGVFYSTTSIGQGQSFETIGNEKYFYPRFGAITFTGSGQQSQPIEMRGEKGFIANPAITALDGFEFDGYQVGNGASFEELWDLVLVPPSPEIAD